MIGDQNVLWLEIPVVDSQRMAKLNRIQNLQEGMLGKGVVSHEMASFCDIGKQISLRAEFDDNKSAVWGIQYPDKRHNIGMLAG